MDNSVYHAHGYDSRRDYLQTLADEYGLPLATVLAFAELLGPGEDFDGLIVALEDYNELELI